MNIYIGSDHRGFALKEQLAAWLQKEGKEVVDVGAFELDPVDDYPAIGFELGQKVAGDPDSVGIALCGSGVGITVAANKVKGVRAAVITSKEIAASARKDDNANIIGIAADFTSMEECADLISTFLHTPFSNEERHDRRISQISEYEA